MENLYLSVVEILSDIRYRILGNVHMPAKFDELSKDDYVEIFSAYHDTCHLLTSLIKLMELLEKYSAEQ